MPYTGGPLVRYSPMVLNVLSFRGVSNLLTIVIEFVFLVSFEVRSNVSKFVAIVESDSELVRFTSHRGSRDGLSE